ncbi:hypothetical protein, partial [Anaerofustis sp.]|uniref:hypothetical protein n=1 Tax=Anaerofustis sp. TaxID=1872517 RepID=UPI0025BC84B7
MSDIGLIEYITSNDEDEISEATLTNFDSVCKYCTFPNAYTYVGQIGGQWLAQTCYKTTIDDFAVIKMFFNHKPTYKEVRIAFDIRDFEQKPIEVFKCSKCKQLTNWLDFDGYIHDKYNMAEDKYCGCK